MHSYMKTFSINLTRDKSEYSRIKKVMQMFNNLKIGTKTVIVPEYSKLFATTTKAHLSSENIS